MNSKLNTFLLIIVIILLAIGIFIKKDDSKNIDDNSQVASEQINKESDTTSADEMGAELTLVSQERMAEDPHVQSAVSGAISMPANFAGHYVIVYVGCGTSCASPAIYDKNTGSLYSIDASVLAGAATNDGMVTINSSVDSDIFTIPKYNVGGTYGARYRLVGTNLIEV